MDKKDKNSNDSIVRYQNDTFKIIDPFIIFASSAAAICSRLICYPLDTLRVRRQFSPIGSNIFTHIRPVSKLYSGMSISLLFGVPAVSSYLTVYYGVKRFLASENNSYLPMDGIGSYAIAGLAAEFVSEVVFTPMEIVKSRMQVGKGIGVMTVFKDIWKESGIQGYFKGYTLGLGVYLPYTILYWTLYENVKKGLAKVPILSKNDNQNLNSNSTLDYLFASAIACGTAASLSNVIDIVKTRYQIASGVKKVSKHGLNNHVSNHLQPESIKEIVINLYKENGWKSFTRGMGLRAIVMIPSNVISMTVFEKLQEHKDLLWPPNQINK